MSPCSTRARRGKLAEGDSTSKAELYRTISGEGNDSHAATQVLYGGAGSALVNSGGVPWTAAYIDSIGEPTCDLRSNIAAEASTPRTSTERAYINATEDPGVREALGLPMTREIAHQKSFEKALYSIEPNFPPGKLPADPRFADASLQAHVPRSEAIREARGTKASSGNISTSARSNMPSTAPTVERR